ncbi:MAG: alpha/beta hydrolase [Oligoflexales bacterium]|nr:alpha/beta hydrolase [Oligoflexales bacterium]
MESNIFSTKVYGYDGTMLNCLNVLHEDPKAIILYVHGYADHSSRWLHVFDRLFYSGYSVYAPDQRCHGKSEGRLGVIRSMYDWVEDIDIMVKYIYTLHPRKPVILFAHSAGGLAAALYVINKRNNLTGLVLSAPAVSSDLSPLAQKTSWLLSKIVPHLGIVYTGSDDMLTHDSGIVEASRNDPLFYKGRIMAITGYALVRGTLDLKKRLHEISLPLLVLQGTADKYVSPDGSRLLFEKASSGDKTFIPYDGFYHEIFNEVEREKPLSDLMEWLEKRYGSRKGVLLEKPAEEAFQVEV